jgi:hypothetical protein
MGPAARHEAGLPHGAGHVDFWQLLSWRALVKGFGQRTRGVSVLDAEMPGV